MDDVDTVQQQNAFRKWPHLVIVDIWSEKYDNGLSAL